MQVKISYTAEVTDVPKEVANILNMLSNDVHKLYGMIETIQNSLDEAETASAKSNINLTKEKMQKMFARLTDCQVIIEGYEGVVNQKNVSKDSAPEG
jgi:hypothetical protein